MVLGAAHGIFLTHSGIHHHRVRQLPRGLCQQLLLTTYLRSKALTPPPHQQLFLVSYRKTKKLCLTLHLHHHWICHHNNRWHFHRHYEGHCHTMTTLRLSVTADHQQHPCSPHHQDLNHNRHHLQLHSYAHVMPTALWKDRPFTP